MDFLFQYLILTLTTSLGPNGVWDLKKNFALIELIERLHASEQKSGNNSFDQTGFSTSFLERERELSVCCDENEAHLAVVYCTTCGTHLCEQCSETTHSTRTLAKHRRYYYIKIHKYNLFPKNRISYC